MLGNYRLSHTHHARVCQSASQYFTVYRTRVTAHIYIIGAKEAPSRRAAAAPWTGAARLSWCASSGTWPRRTSRCRARRPWLGLGLGLGLGLELGLGLGLGLGIAHLAHVDERPDGVQRRRGQAGALEDGGDLAAAHLAPLRPHLLEDLIVLGLVRGRHCPRCIRRAKRGGRGCRGGRGRGRGRKRKRGRGRWRGRWRGRGRGPRVGRRHGSDGRAAEHVV